MAARRGARHSDAVSERPDVARPDIGSYRRVELLTDAIFGIVMTLVVIEIGVPEGPASELGAQLRALAPTFLVYALTFVTLGALWFGNRTQGESIERADHPFVWLTLLMLGLLALVPFSAGVLGDFPLSRLAVVLFGLHLTLVFALHGALWLYVSSRPWLLRAGVTEAYRRRARPLVFLPALGYAAATLLGAAVPLAGLIGYLVVPVPLVSGVFYRRLARVERDSRAA